MEGDEPEAMHEVMGSTLDEAIESIREIQSNARSKNDTTRPRWPMIVLNRLLKKDRPAALDCFTPLSFGGRI